MVEVIVPVAICVVLPVMVVWLTMRSRINRENKRAEILITALNNNPDSEMLAELLSRQVKTPREVLESRLLRGCIFSLLGLTFGIAGLWASLQEYGDSDIISLLFGLLCGVCLAIGISYLILFFVTRRSVE